jgi:catechol 2,3-dioxygenase-like lactoylglutathione lyase family enzyme
MKPRIHVITLAVADLDRALAFYRDGLGFRTEGLIGTEFKGDETIPDGTTAVFHLDGGLMLSIYPRSELAKDAVIPLTEAKPGEFSIGHGGQPGRGRRSHRTGQSGRSSRHRLTS